MEKIGYSTGVLYNTTLRQVKRVQMFKGIGCNAVELGFGRREELENFVLDFVMKHELKTLDYVSIHAPWDLMYGNNIESEEVFNKIKSISDCVRVDGVIFHPPKIKDYNVLEKSGLPILIENMSERKGHKTGPKYFEDLKNNHDFGFCLDIQHAYESDSSMNIAYELKDSMGEKLKELHVSGNSPESSHYPLYKAYNKDAIGKVIKDCKDVPIIIESIDKKEGFNFLNEEFNHIKSILE